MTQSLLAMAKELTLAQIQAGQVAPNAMNSVISATFETLCQLRASASPETPESVPVRSADWHTSITKYAVVCLECGKSFKQLSTRHLRVHGLDSQKYRQKYRIPRTQSLAAQETRARRRSIVQRSRPWEKTETFRNRQKAAAKNQPKRHKQTL